MAEPEDDLPDAEGYNELDIITVKIALGGDYAAEAFKDMLSLCAPWLVRSAEINDAIAMCRAIEEKPELQQEARLVVLGRMSDLAKGKRLLIDTESSPQGPLFTRQSRQLIIPEDRDFEQILAAAEGRVDYVAVDSRGARADSRFLASVLAVVAGGSNGTWTIDQTFDTITLYKYTARQ